MRIITVEHIGTNIANLIKEAEKKNSHAASSPEDILVVKNVSLFTLRSLIVYFQSPINRTVYKNIVLVRPAHIETEQEKSQSALFQQNWRSLVGKIPQCFSLIISLENFSGIPNIAEYVNNKNAAKALTPTPVVDDIKFKKPAVTAPKLLIKKRDAIEAAYLSNKLSEIEESYYLKLQCPLSRRLMDCPVSIFIDKDGVRTLLICDAASIEEHLKTDSTTRLFGNEILLQKKNGSFPQDISSVQLLEKLYKGVIAIITSSSSSATAISSSSNIQVSQLGNFSGRKHARDSIDQHDKKDKKICTQEPIEVPSTISLNL